MRHYARCPRCKQLFRVPDRGRVLCPCSMVQTTWNVSAGSPPPDTDLADPTECVSVSVLDGEKR